MSEPGFTTLNIELEHRLDNIFILHNYKQLLSVSPEQKSIKG